MIDHGNSGTGVRLVMGAMATPTSPPPSPATPACAAGRWGGSPTPWRSSAPRRAGARRAAADHADRRGEPDSGALHDPGALGAGEVGGAARRAERARRDGGDRAGADPRPYRADARGLRRDVRTEETPDGRVITLRGQPELRPQAIAVPRDPSSAAFPVAAALLVAGLGVTLPGIGLNPTRAGIYTTLHGDGRRHRLGEPPRGGRRAGRGPARALRAAAGHRGAAGAGAVDDRRVPDPGRAGGDRRRARR